MIIGSCHGVLVVEPDTDLRAQWLDTGLSSCLGCCFVVVW